MLKRTIFYVIEKSVLVTLVGPSPLILWIFKSHQATLDC